MNKNKTITTIVACIPGAGQMYMGYMKLGSSTMALFALLWFLSSTMQMGTLMFLIPVLWFFSFFDTLNKNSGRNNEPDHYIFANQAKGMQSNTFRITVAFMLILCGGSTLLTFISNTFSQYLPWQVSNFLNNVSYNAPKVIIAVFILYIGITLITNKKDI